MTFACSVVILGKFVFTLTFLPNICCFIFTPKSCHLYAIILIFLVTYHFYSVSCVIVCLTSTLKMAKNSCDF